MRDLGGFAAPDFLALSPSITNSRLQTGKILRARMMCSISDETTIFALQRPDNGMIVEFKLGGSARHSVLTPVHVHLRHLLPIILKTEMLCHEVGQHEQCTRGNADRLDDLHIQVVGTDISVAETPT